MPTPPLTLYQAEWCPFSSAVREVLTELGVDVVLRQVEPWPKQREQLRAIAGTDQIPVLETEDGEFHRGTRAIFAYLQERAPWEFAPAHRRRFAAHSDARETDVPGQLIEFFRGTDELEAVTRAASVEEAAIVDVPERDRFELRLDGRLIGLLAYRRVDGRIVFTHTEVTPACEGRGFGRRLVAAGLDAARKEGLAVVALCPFVAHYVEQHAEYQELVASPPDPLTT